MSKSNPAQSPGILSELPPIWTPGATIAIIGGGAAGALVAAQLQERPASRIFIIEPNARVGRGHAYGTEDDNHLLNVRAANMSARPEDPLHFVRWLHAKSPGESEDTLKSRFFPRRIYGEYLGSLLETPGKITHLQDWAVGISRTERGIRVQLETHGFLDADFAVLALGNMPPALPAALQPIASSPRVIINPWKAGVLKQIGNSDRVLILGTGLTMVDAVLSLNANGHEGRIYARSRRALLPYSHAATSPVTTEIDPAGDLFRQVIDAVRKGGENWRAVVDSLRPKTVALWQSLSWKDRDRFRTRLQPYWDIHRHRMPESAWEVVSALQAFGTLDIGHGRVTEAEPTSDTIQVHLSSAEGVENLEVDWIVNCTGPALHLQEARLPLLESAVAEGLVQYDRLGLGVMVDDQGKTHPQARVWALGPICRGCRLETTAIPEIRAQAAQIAEDILRVGRQNS